jgi:formylglycine-generating enzyme required for sulfatase activity
VSWDDTQAYLAWLNRQAGSALAFRLPTEAEWEYAARAGSGSKRYPWGDDLESRTQCRWANGADQSFVGQRRPSARWELAACDDHHVFTAPAKAFEANAFGLHHMHGNVWEWVQDKWHPNYDGAPVDGSAWQHIDDALWKAWQATGSPERETRVLRGGAWNSPPENLRSASRSFHRSNEGSSSVGFRVVREVKD